MAGSGRARAEPHPVPDVGGGSVTWPPVRDIRATGRGTKGSSQGSSGPGRTHGNVAQV
jgi:hypothetical protein